MRDYQALLEFCNTDRQREVIQACMETGSQGQAATEVGLARQNISRMVKDIERRAAQRGHSPKHDMTHTVPEGFSVKGTSTYYNEDGKPTGQWVKTQADRDAQLRILQDSLIATFSDIEPLKREYVLS